MKLGADPGRLHRKNVAGGCAPDPRWGSAPNPAEGFASRPPVGAPPPDHLEGRGGRKGARKGQRGGAPSYILAALGFGGGAPSNRNLRYFRIGG